MTPLTFNPSGIPDELKTYPNFVLWQRELRDGKTTKVPYQINGQKAASTRAETWTTFPAAVSSYQSAGGKYDGIGFCLTEETPIGIDLDHCRCPAFANHGFEIILPWAQDIIDKVDSYTEASPSGKGIRIFAKGGKLPVGGRKKGNFEIYQSGRYLTVTGNHIAGTPTNIMDRPDIIESVFNDIFGSKKDRDAGEKTQPHSNFNVTEILEKAFTSTTGEQIRKLYHGDYSDYPSQSEADLALCSHLAFWLSNDPAAMDQAFRASGLYRLKWDRKHHADGSTYGEETIRKVIAGNRETYTGAQSEATSQETWSEPLPLPEGLAPVMKLEEAMIPEPFCKWLMDISNRMQIPPDFSTAAAIVATGSVISRACGIYPKCHDDWIVVPNLWGAVVGRPSLMKSPAVSEAHRHLNRLEAEAREDYKNDATVFEANEEFTKLKRAAINEEIKRAVKKNDVSKIESRRAELAGLHCEAPIRRRYQTQDGTTEKIGELLLQNPRGFLINRDELTGWFRSLDRDGREGDRAFYLEAWNGNRGYTYDRIGRGTLDVEALCLSLFGTITPGALSSYVYQCRKGGIGDDGLLQRFQVLVWPDAPSDWKNIDRFPDTAEKNRAWDIFKKLSGDIPGAVIEEEGSIPCLRFSPGGQEVFDSWRENLEKRVRGDHCLHPAMESHLTKYRKLMPALSLIFHLVEVADNKATGGVSEIAALRAASWCDYLETHAIRIYGAAVMPGLESAREIIKHIRRGDIKDKIRSRDIYRNHWARLDTTEEVKSGLDILEAHDWLIVKKTSTGGRPSDEIWLNPHIKV